MSSEESVAALVREHVVTELKSLARGEGVNAYDLTERLGPHLRRALGVATGQPGSSVRTVVVKALDRAVQRLPETVQPAVLAGLGLRAGAQMWFLGDRLNVVAAESGYSVKTVRRRYLEGMELLADVLLTDHVEHAETPPTDFWCADFGIELVLRGRGIELIETRTIVADQAGLDTVPLAWASGGATLADGERLTVDCLHGGLILPDDGISEGSWRGRLALPRALRPGERHEFRLRVVDPGHTDPFVILTPQRRVDRLLVRVKFPLRHGDAAPPPAVERLDGILARFVTDQTLRGTPVEVDAVGEVAEEFRGLRAGFSYGVRWRAGSTQA